VFLRRKMMLNHELVHDLGIFVLSPAGPLETADIKEFARRVDPYIQRYGDLKGMMIYTETFSGWKDVASIGSHIRFIKDHHRSVAKVATVSDSRVLFWLQKIIGSFVRPKVRHFAFSDEAAALEWLKY
jgi:predicted RNA binding protein YcfA (HicA-like mRNA interferase family)